MKKYIAFLLSILLAFSIFILSASAETYTVVSGDSLWKIAKKYQVGLSELIEANPQILNPNLIYPKQVINIPEKDTSVLNYEKEVVRLVNKERASRGLSLLTLDWELSRVARYKSQDMHDKGYFSHTSPTYGSPFDMLSDFGIKYRSAGENIAKGQRTPQEVVNAWMNSSGHRANILNASFTKIGVGYVADGNYWTQMFIG
ncbi:MAG: SafA/ExsA family spore coat assembly protein [Clostridia bacterium]|nr:SafA/ExsA family spore coat assembly protein [Clostridia bacterium]